MVQGSQLGRARVVNPRRNRHKALHRPATSVHVVFTDRAWDAITSSMNEQEAQAASWRSQSSLKTIKEVKPLRINARNESKDETQMTNL